MENTERAGTADRVFPPPAPEDGCGRIPDGRNGQKPGPRPGEGKEPDLSAVRYGYGG